jgi:hypothetical protein
MSGSGWPAWDDMPREGLRRTVLYGLVLVALMAGVVYPLRRYVVEPRRQALLGYRESPGRRLALASQFGFDTAAGDPVRLVPGAPARDLADLPGEAVTLILGGFRAPYVVYLWMKVEDEKQQKVHFDLIDRYTKIAALQSDYPQMWVFHAWNMAWNVSVQWQSPERKYQWIRRAIDFLKEGYRKNPHSPEIMAEMGRIYSEKLGRSQEASFYRARVLEDEGRSTFLAAYEWYDRARRATDRYGSSGHSLSKPVLYSQACHALSYYAAEMTQQAYDALRKSLEARRAGREADARASFDRGRDRLAQAAGAWQWARREWYDHAVRFEREGASTLLLDIYKRFYDESDNAATQVESLRSELTYDNLPDVFAKMHRPEIK